MHYYSRKGLVVFSVFLVIFYLITPLQHISFAEEDNKDEVKVSIDDYGINEINELIVNWSVSDSEVIDKIELWTDFLEDPIEFDPNETEYTLKVPNDFQANFSFEIKALSSENYIDSDFLYFNFYDGKYYEENDPDIVIEILDLTSESTNDSITIEWEVSREDLIDEFEIYLEDEYIETVAGVEKSYTFENLITGKDYEFGVRAKSVFGHEYFYYTTDNTYWLEDDMTQVQIMTIMNEEPSYDDFIRIRGLEENKYFEYEDWLLDQESDLFLPYGNFEVTVYNEEDKSIVMQREIEIKKGINYIQTPIQLQFDVKKAREEAEPFEYKVEDVMEDSFTLSWNSVSKIQDFELWWWSDEWDNDSDSSYGSVEFDNDTTTYKVTNLKENTVYSTEFFANYLFDLSSNFWFKVKTDGADANADKLVFNNNKLEDTIKKEIGIYSRDVTVEDMKDLRYLSVYNSELDILEHLEYAINLTSLNGWSNNIEKIDQLKLLNNLNDLDLDNNNITDISPLTDLMNLEFLNLNYNEITDIG